MGGETAVNDADDNAKHLIRTFIRSHILATITEEGSTVQQLCRGYTQA